MSSGRTPRSTKITFLMRSEIRQDAMPELLASDSFCSDISDVSFPPPYYTFAFLGVWSIQCSSVQYINFTDEFNCETWLKECEFQESL